MLAVPNPFRVAMLGCLLALAPGPAGCSSSSSPGVTCCPPSAFPACCMNYGGTKDASGCKAGCDNIPDPKDHRWELRKDVNGCDYWYAPPEIPMSCNPR